jgi:amino acid adenylation domain-containing protein
MQPFLQDLLLASSSRVPQRTALVCGARRLTYGELARQAAALAETLGSAGVARMDRVLVVADNSVEFAVSFWAVLMAGAVLVPVHPATPAARLAWYADDTQARAVLRNGSLSAPPAPPALAPGDDAPAGLAAILYTSGSTGVPKGVMLSHANMLAAAQSIQAYLGYREDDVVLAALPMSFDYGLYQMILAFAAGARLVLEPSFQLLPQVVARMARERVTVFPGMPTVFALLARFPALASYDLSCVRLVTSTGAPLGQAQAGWVQGAFPSAQLYSMYGLTECKRCSYLPPQDLARKPGSVGIAMPGLRFWVVDGQGRRLPPDTVGELVVQGPTVMQGYWRDAQASSERLRDGPEGKLLHTGDLCRIDAEGYLYVVGRMDDMIKSRGQRVAPREIEAALLDVPWVRDAAVVGIPDEVQGQAIKAFVVVDPGAPASESALRDALRERIEPRLIPSRMEFRDALPVGPTGKTDRARLG